MLKKQQIWFKIDFYIVLFSLKMVTNLKSDAISQTACGRSYGNLMSSHSMKK